MTVIANKIGAIRSKARICARSRGVAVDVYGAIIEDAKLPFELALSNRALEFGCDRDI
jgi:hypothetical protein